ncbi:MAG: hypothetical protein LBK97_04690 [Prevotellaceae bacterium]|jgi:hypothetical protein|nr:hypothetical protein [Prevotellaceae bacterium]
MAKELTFLVSSMEYINYPTWIYREKLCTRMANIIPDNERIECENTLNINI